MQLWTSLGTYLAAASLVCGECVWRGRGGGVRRGQWGGVQKGCGEVVYTMQDEAVGEHIRLLLVRS